MTHASTSSRLTKMLSYVERDPDNMALRKNAVRKAFVLGQWLTARELTDNGLIRLPDDAELLALSGLSHLQAQQYLEAERNLSAALAQGLGPAEVRYNLAFALFMQKRYAEALELLTAPLLPFELPLVLRLRARCLYSLALPERAISDCKAYLVLVPDDAEAMGLLGLMLYEQHDAESAECQIDNALEREPTQLEALFARACMQFEAQQVSTARDTYESLLRLHPRCGRGWLGAALLNLSQLQFKTALQDIERAAECMPEHIGTWHVLAWIQILLADVDAAAAAFARAMTVDRNFGETHGGLAVVAALRGREAEASAHIKRALRLDPDAMSPRYAQMLLCQRAGRPGEARAILDEVLARPVSHGDMLYRDLVALQMKRRAKTTVGSGPH